MAPITWILERMMRAIIMVVTGRMNGVRLIRVRIYVHHALARIPAVWIAIWKQEPSGGWWPDWPDGIQEQAVPCQYRTYCSLGINTSQKRPLQNTPNLSPSILLIFSGAFGAVKKNILLFVPYIAIIFVASFTPLRFVTQAFQSVDKGEANGDGY